MEFLRMGAHLRLCRQKRHLGNASVLLLRWWNRTCHPRTAHTISAIHLQRQTEELEKLREPFAALNPTWWNYQCGLTGQGE